MSYFFTYKIGGNTSTYKAESPDEMQAIFLFALDVVGLKFPEEVVYHIEELLTIIEQEGYIDFDYFKVED